MKMIDKLLYASLTNKDGSEHHKIRTLINHHCYCVYITSARKMHGL